MSRKTARETAMLLFYEYAITGKFNADTIEVMHDVIDKKNNNADYEYINEIIENFEIHREEIDGIIKKYIVDWSFERLSKTDLSIIRLALFEIIHMNTPFKVAINEAVELAKIYSGDKAPSFINGVLGGYINNGR